MALSATNLRGRELLNNASYSLFHGETPLLFRQNPFCHEEGQNICMIQGQRNQIHCSTLGKIIIRDFRGMVFCRKCKGLNPSLLHYQLKNS